MEMYSKKKSPIKKKILIIGGNGFLGNYLYDYLLKKKFIVFQINKSKKKKKNSFSCDISNVYELKDTIKSIDLDFDFVINLSGQNLKNKSYLKKIIVKGNKNLIKIFSKTRTKICYISTSLVYGNSLKLQSENFKIKPVSEYGKFKLLGEKIYKEHCKNYLIIRLANIYDNFFKKKSLINNIFSSIKSNKRVKITNLNTIRNYMHVDDFCKLIYKSISLKQKKTILNFGSENISINEIVRIIERKAKSKIKINNYKFNTNIDPSIRLNTNKMINIFKYKPKIKLQNTLETHIKNNEI